MNVMKIVSKEDREFLKKNLNVGDRVRVANFEWELGECEYCEYEIGVDEYMFDYEYRYIKVDKILPHFDCTCGALAFNAEGWMWSTCWVDEYELPRHLQEPTWEL